MIGSLRLDAGASKIVPTLERGNENNTHLGLPPNILGSEVVTDLALKGFDDLLGACFVVEPDPVKAAELLDERIKLRRRGLGLSE